MKRVNIEDRPHKDHQRKDNHHSPDDLVDQQDSIIIKFASDLIHQPSQPKPPQQCAEDNPREAYAHLEFVVGNDKSELRKQRHKHKDHQRIGESHQKSSHAVVNQCAFLAAADVHIFRWIRSETIHAEDQKNDAGSDLKNETVMRILDKIHHKTHSQTRD